MNKKSQSGQDEQAYSMQGPTQRDRKQHGKCWGVTSSALGERTGPKVLAGSAPTG